nr:spidroin-1-like [Aegilops tauschii subsp. strangulata]
MHTLCSNSGTWICGRSPSGLRPKVEGGGRAGLGGALGRSRPWRGRLGQSGTHTAAVVPLLDPDWIKGGRGSGKDPGAGRSRGEARQGPAGSGRRSPDLFPAAVAGSCVRQRRGEGERKENEEVGEEGRGSGAHLRRAGRPMARKGGGAGAVGGRRASCRRQTETEAARGSGEAGGGADGMGPAGPIWAAPAVADGGGAGTGGGGGLDAGGG